jgi:hypothetical protein
VARNASLLKNNLPERICQEKWFAPSCIGTGENMGWAMRRRQPEIMKEEML